MRLRLEAAGRRMDLTGAWTDVELTNGLTVAPTLTIGLRDPGRTLVNDQLLAADAAPPTLDLEGRTWRLQQTSKDGNALTLTFEDDRAVRLRRQAGELTVTEGTITLARFLRRLAGDARVPVDLIDVGRIDEQLGRSDDETSWDAIRRLAGEADAHAYLSQGGLVVAGDRALTGRQPSVQLAEKTGGVDHIDFIVDARRRAETVTVELRAEPGRLVPGVEVRIAGLRPAGGRWIVGQVTWQPHRTATTVELVRFGTARQDLP